MTTIITCIVRFTTHRVLAAAALLRAATVHGSESWPGRSADLQNKRETGNVLVAEGQQTDRDVPEEVRVGQWLDNPPGHSRRLFLVGAIGHPRIRRWVVGVSSHGQRFHHSGRPHQSTGATGGSRTTSTAEAGVRDVDHYARPQYYRQGRHSSRGQVCLAIRQPTGATEMVPGGPRAALNARPNE